MSKSYEDLEAELHYAEHELEKLKAAVRWLGSVQVVRETLAQIAANPEATDEAREGAETLLRVLEEEEK